MFERKAVAALIALVFGLGIVLLSSSGASAERREAAPDPTPRRALPADEEEKDEDGGRAATKTDRVIQLDRTSTRELRSMPDNQRIRVKGREMTVGEYRRRLKKEQMQATAKLRRSRGKGTRVNIAALQKAFDEKEEARLKSANAKVAAELAKLRQRGSPGDGNGTRVAEIRKEAAEIQARTRGGGATPQDKARAQQLFQEYQELR